MGTLGWTLYAVAVATLMAGAAEHLERHHTFAGRRRWLWLGMLTLGVALPLLRLGLARTTVGLPALVELPPLTVGPAVGAAAGPDAPGPIPWWPGAWLGASLTLLVLYGWASWRLMARSRRWRRTRVDGVPVIVSAGVGPAVLGMWRPEILLPSWALALDEEHRDMILRHEAEHARHRDPLWMAVAFLLVVAMPWNAALWWALGRFRRAVETDCDHRVLASGDVRAQDYAQLLVRVGAHPTRRVPALAGFGERTSTLERRIRTMLGFDARQVWARTAVGALLVVMACGVDAPRTESPFEPQGTELNAKTAQIMEEPTFTPFTVAPSILNREEVIQAMKEAYPPLLRDAGVGGTVRVYFFITADGRVAKKQIDKSSGVPEIDAAALAVADAYRFGPALNRDQKVPVWVSFPITFQTMPREDESRAN